MKRLFLLILLTISFNIKNNVFCQDIIKTRKGEEIKASLLGINRKEAMYKVYNDPEFSTYTIPYKEISSIKEEGAKKEILFNHHLPRGYISISATGNGSIPLGDLSSTSFGSPNHQPGFAKRGPGFKYEIGFYVYKRIGISFCFGQYNNKYDYQKYADSYRDETNTDNASASETMYNNGGKDKVRDNSWTFNHLLVGPMYSLKLGRRFTLDLKARGGLMGTSRPNVVLSFFHNLSAVPTHYIYIFHQKSSNSFGYNFGTTFRFLMTKRLALCVSADYFHTSPTMNIEIESHYPYPYTTGTKIHYNFSSLNYMVGLSYQFKRKRNKYE